MKSPQKIEIDRFKIVQNSLTHGLKECPCATTMVYNAIVPFVHTQLVNCKLEKKIIFR